MAYFLAVFYCSQKTKNGAEKTAIKSLNL